jgi:hypothetical protein
MAKQQRLQFAELPRDDYGRWVRHAGVEDACNRLALWLIQGGRLWLSSETMAGKSHFLSALKQEHPRMGLSMPKPGQTALRQVECWLSELSPYAYWAIDMPAGKASHSTAMALFHLIERAREMNRALLIAWRCPNEALAPPELASRLRMFERIEMEEPVADAELKAVLRSAASALHWEIPETISRLMLTHLPRSLDVQIKALHQLEAVSLEERARISQSWAKQVLQI